MYWDWWNTFVLLCKIAWIIFGYHIGYTIIKQMFFAPNKLLILRSGAMFAWCVVMRQVWSRDVYSPIAQSMAENTCSIILIHTHHKHPHNILKNKNRTTYANNNGTVCYINRISPSKIIWSHKHKDLFSLAL